MVTALQIALLLILIALIGIILGYLFGRLACKKREKNLYFEKSDYCDEQYNKSFSEDESVNKVNAHYNNSLAEAKGKMQQNTVSSGSGASTEGLGIAGMTGATAAVSASEADGTVPEESKSSVSSGKNMSSTEDISDDKSVEGLTEQEDAAIAKEESSSGSDDSSEAVTDSSGGEDITVKEDNESTTGNKTAGSANDESSSDSSEESSAEENNNNNAETVEREEGALTEEDGSNGDDGSKKEESNSADSNSEDAEDSLEEELNDNESKPATLLEPREGGKDNLCRIKGVGNIIEGKLNDLGVYHFDQIAAWTEKEIVWVDSHLAFSGRILREDWIGQAKLLATGAETEFSKRVDEGKVSTSQIK